MNPPLEGPRASAPPPSTLSTPSTPGPAVLETLKRVAERLERGAHAEALALLGKDPRDPWLVNARAVCLLRLGRAEEALPVLRAIALHDGSPALDRERPTVFATNLATALLACGNVAGCLTVLDELDRDDLPEAAVLLACVERWRRGMSRWQRLKFSLYGISARPVELPERLGDLGLSAGDVRRTA